MKCHYFVWFVIPLLREAISVCHGFNIEHVSLKPELGENELSSNAGFSFASCEQVPEMEAVTGSEMVVWSSDWGTDWQSSILICLCVGGHGNKYTNPKHWRGPLPELGKIKGTAFRRRLSNTQHFAFVTCSQPSLSPCCSPVSWGRTHCCPCPSPSLCHPHWKVLIGAFLLLGLSSCGHWYFE